MYKEFFMTEKAGFKIIGEISSSERIIKITYGEQINTTRSYKEACFLIGAAILHAASCDGFINSDKLEE